MPTSELEALTGIRQQFRIEDVAGCRLENAHLLTKEPTGRVLVLINPFSGQKRAEKLWAEHGAHVLHAAGIDADYPKHATRIIQNLDIDRYDAVLVNSGDGLVTEVICGLLLRKDRERALKFPICHIPGGTSNALAAAICYACNKSNGNEYSSEPFSSRDVFITECCLMTTRPRYIPLRLYNVETEHDGTKSMFMSANWGLVADIELPRVATYRARLSYIPVQCKATSRKTMLKYNCERKMFGAGHFDYEEVDQATGLERLEKEHFSSLEASLEGTSLISVPPLGQPLDENWQTVEGDWVMANVSTLSHLGSDVPFLPSARLDEETMYLTVIDWNTVKSRFHVAHLFIFMESSKHLAHPCMQIIPVKAVRVEPMTSSGYFAIDGEPCRSGSSFQVVPSKYCATVIGREEVSHTGNK
ncbi:diacylglycerol kinase catalytic domain protein [Ancylostoma ceylanicum]|uniref:Diacylglycerol kinase catalytic domain protein n=1 Tax=Ancylostoma ceylanicum TaxID=53326 RepID=A0A0D6LW18_9BILA|nr:diacylglycerol kinase catalytic domain protein [Ancylostoma ceylanicum]